MKTRILNSNDCAEYRAIRLESLKEAPYAFGADYNQQKNLDKLRVEKALAEDNPDFIVVGIEDNSRLVGIVVCVREKNFELLNIGVLNQMYIRASYRGMGLSHLLLEKVVKVAFTILKVKTICLTVTEHNKVAENIYRNFGFCPFTPVISQNEREIHLKLEKESYDN